MIVPLTLAVLFGLERCFPLRQQRHEPASRRVLRNLLLAGLTGVVISRAERPLIAPLSALVARLRLGLVPRLPLPRAVRALVALALLDYTLYWWHILLHRVPWLWRLHLVHHSDLELDTATALRFHFGEFLASIPYRAAQIAVIGVGPRLLALWQRLTVLEVLFHHSNLRLPVALERRLMRVVVTPRLHGIHHSIVREETGSNFSSGLTCWDLLHGTIKANVPQQQVTIGVPAWRRVLNLRELLVLPVRELPPIWQLPDNGAPARQALPGSSRQLST